ncbi:MAG: exo-alpha-sialidase [Planctomycetota bacterium]|nr:exo-alpha-sialidase [Planctomycetota bacterium]
MKTAATFFAALLLAWLTLAGAKTAAADRAGPDPRNFANGLLIPDESYCDQPRIVVTCDGTWVVVLTTARGDEGSGRQHVVAANSDDKGRTWSALVDIEPADENRKSSYAIAMITPADRIYAFYCYNGDGIRVMPNGTPIRDDMQGWFCYRFSDDKGRTWSQRQRLPMRLTAADRNNEWRGKLQMFWAIGTPARFGNTAVFGFTKLGRYMLEDGEGWLFRSDNILSESDPTKLRWEMLPDGDRGVRAAEFGSVQEEHDIVHLTGQSLFCVYRTALGHAACSYSRDGGHTWEKPQPLTYAPGGRAIKQPRACAKIWKTRAGQYLLWFHNNGTTTYNNGPNAGSRNIAWLSSGELREGLLHWSQPEIVTYVEGGLEGCSYPDLIEDGGKFFICATQKTEARVFEVDSELLKGLVNQPTNKTVASAGLVLDLAGEACGPQASPAAPRLSSLIGSIEGRTRPLSRQAGFTIDAVVRFNDLSPGQIIVDSRDGSGAGYVLQTTDRQTVRLDVSDGWRGAYWECDAGLLKAGVDHHTTVIVDAGPKVIMFVIDGQLCNGGKQRPFGYGWFDANLKDVSGARTLRLAAGLRGELRTLRIYDRALRVSEAVGSFRAPSGRRGG